MFRKDKIYINLYGIFIFIFLLITGNYFDYQQTLIYGGADGKAYIEIANSFPNWAANKIEYHYAQRFLIPYLIGGAAQIIDINVFDLFRITAIFFISSLIFLSIKMAKYFSKKPLTQVLIINLIVLNPYLTRFFISIPTIINDLIFINLSCIIIISLLRNKERLYIFYSILSFATRQTGIAFFISLLISKFLFKAKSKIKNYNIILLFLGYLLIFILTTLYAKNSSSSNFNYSSINGMIYYIQNNLNTIQLIKFLILPLLSYGLLIFYVFFFLKKRSFVSENNYKLILIILSILIIVGQPLLAGPDVAGKNIIRLTSLAYIIVLNLVLIFFEEKEENKFIYFFLFFQFIYSLHPTFSFLKNIT